MDTTNSTNLKELVVVANALKKEVPTRQVKLIHSKVLPKIVSEAAKSRAPYRSLYEHAHNAFSSMADGLRTGEAGVGEYQQFVSELANLASKATALEERPVKPKQTEATTDSEQWLNQQSDNAARVMRKYQKFLPLVPRSLPKKFYAGRFPVIPLTNPVLNREQLQQFKMMDDSLFGYPIVKNQVVLGLNSDWVISDYKRDVQEALQDVLEVLASQTNKTYYVLGEPKLRGLVYWSWLVTDNEMRKLNKSTMAGHFQLKSWSFPFEADDALQRAAR